MDSVLPLSRMGWKLDMGRRADPSQFEESPLVSVPLSLVRARDIRCLHKVVLRITFERPSGKLRVPIEPGAGP